MAAVFFSWRQAILESGLQPTTRHVLLTLACHMNDAGESCYPSIELLCKETGLSNRAVITHLQKANQAGWIKVSKHGFAGQRWANHEYRMSWPDGVFTAGFIKKAVNEVHDLKEKAVNVIPKAVNVIPKGNEPNDKKAVNEVHPSTSTSTPLNTSVSTSLNTASSRANQSSLLADINPQIATDYLAIRKAKNSPLTATALNAIKREAEKAHYTLEQALTACCERGWVGFKAEWILKDSPTSRTPNRQEALEASNRAATAGWMPPELREIKHAN